MDNNDILSITLHVGQFVEGQVASNINVDKYDVALTLTDIGVRMRGKHTNSLIPFSNIQAIAFKNNDK